MRRLAVIFAAAMILLPIRLFAQEPIQLVGLLELSGAGASVGKNMKDGLELAVKEINASGGVLGRKLEVTVFDTQTNPSIAKALVQRAIDMDAYAVIGPIFSGSMIVSMLLRSIRGDTARARSTSVAWM